MTKPGRIPCIKPTCKRTAPVEKFGSSTEIICGKCFKSLPAGVRDGHRRCWREINKWRRRIAKTSDELKLQRMHVIERNWTEKLHANWQLIRAAVTNPEKPEGLDAFLAELGL